MSDEQINIAIFEHLGGYFMDADWHHPNGARVTLSDPRPNYANDLNAAIQALCCLGRKWEVVHVRDGYLCRIEFGPRGNDVVAAGLELGKVISEAFLRTINKWKE
jgi:hypothetical protein